MLKAQVMVCEGSRAVFWQQICWRWAKTPDFHFQVVDMAGCTEEEEERLSMVSFNDYLSDVARSIRTLGLSEVVTAFHTGSW